jgi:7-cyano-7-deazaguanine synthase
VLLNVAAAFAEAYECKYVVTGFNRDEAEDFPDNRREYAKTVNEGLAMSTRNGVEAVSFTQELGKPEIIALGVELGAPLSVIWSCYDGGEMMCGRCASCLHLKRALDSLSVEQRPVIHFDS